MAEIVDYAKYSYFGGSGLRNVYPVILAPVEASPRLGLIAKQMKLGIAISRGKRSQPNLVFLRTTGGSRIFPWGGGLDFRVRCVCMCVCLIISTVRKEL